MSFRTHVVESSPSSATGCDYVFIPFCPFSQSEQNAKKGEDLDADDKIGEEDSHFMKLAKKLTAKTLQRKGGFDARPHTKNPNDFKTSSRVFVQ